MRPSILIVLAGLPILALSACATVTSCVPIAIVVAAKEDRAPALAAPGSLTTTETGYVREIPQDRVAREFWLKDTNGRWDRVSESIWRSTEVGKSVEVCR